MARRRSPAFIDLFSGAGLFSAGFIDAGFRAAQAVELDACAAESYRRNVAPVICNGDVNRLSPVQKVDVLIAGPPCQGFSTLGRQDPTDARNALSLRIPRWVRDAAPKVVVVENVPPFLRSHHWKKLSSALKRLGYSIETWELEAYEFGTPQLRRRAFTVASKVGEIGAPSPTGCGSTVGKALRGLHPDDDGGDPMHVWSEFAGLARKRVKHVPVCGDRRDIVKAAPRLCPPSWFSIGCQATDVWGRMDAKQPANTLRCEFQNPSKGRYLHPTADRTLSLREGARLQGIPDEWLLFGKRWPVARQIGNGVPVPLAQAVARRVKEALS